MAQTINKNGQQVQGFAAWASTNAYKAGDMVTNGTLVYTANGNIPANTNFTIGTTGATWSVVVGGEISSGTSTAAFASANGSLNVVIGGNGITTFSSNGVSIAGNVSGGDFSGTTLRTTGNANIGGTATITGNLSVGSSTAFTVGTAQNAAFTTKTFGETYIASNNSHGGNNYAGIATWDNTSVGATNGKKYWRINDVGNIEIVNSNYSSVIFTMNDSGNLTTGTVNAMQITANSANAFTAGPAAVSGVGLQLPQESAIRNYYNGNNAIYFDVSVGGSTDGTFRFRGSNAFTEYAAISKDGIKARTPFINKTSYGAASDTEITVGNYRFRVSSNNPQVISNTSGTVNSAWVNIACISGFNIEQNNGSTGTLLPNSSWTTLYSSHSMSNSGDVVATTIQDKTAGRCYRVTFMRSDSGFSIVAEQLI